MAEKPTAEEYEARNFKTSQAHLTSFLNLDEPRRVSQSPKEEPKYSLNIELAADSDDLKALRAKIVAQAQAMWPGWDIGAKIKSGELVVPITDGTVLADKALVKGKKREWSRGLKVVTARTQKAPVCGVIANGGITQLDDKAAIVAHKASHFYTGVRCYVELSIVPYDAVGKDGKPGVTAYLSSVLSTGKGEKLISGRDIKETFSGYVGLESEEDPTGGKAGDADW